jgi:Papain-like cysteine protease AvrRpt2
VKLTVPLRTQNTIPIPITPPQDGRLIPVPRLKQCQTEWCWAACAQMVLRYYGDANIKQCDIAHKAFPQIGCCNAPATCNQRLSRDEVTQLWQNCGMQRLPYKQAVGFDVLQTEINDSRPVEVGITRPSRGGHLAVVRGWSLTASGQMVNVADPLFEIGNIPFSWLQKGYGYGQWSDTWAGLEPKR